MRFKTDQVKVDKQQVEKLADLARLEFSEDEKEAFVQDFQKIVSFVEKLNELDTQGVEPLVYISEATNVLRTDQVRQTISHEDAMSNAPEADSDYFRVPKFIRK